MKELLFKDFPEVSAEQWKNQITSGLKGADYDTLIYKSPDGIEIQPFYTSEDIKGKIQLPPPKQWKICEQVCSKTAREANAKARNALEKGAQSLFFCIASQDMSPKEVLEGIDLATVSVYFKMEREFPVFRKALDIFLTAKEHHVKLLFDPLADLARSGNWDPTEEEALKAPVSRAATAAITVDSSLYQNAGANIPEQLAFSLAQMNEYLNLYRYKGIGSSQPLFLVASGRDYFSEIAKIKALRWLYASLAREYNLPETCQIMAFPTRRDKTIYDYNVNLLRSTTQAMSAVLGGADIVSNLAFDSSFKNSDFGERIARNQLLVMKNEAYFDKALNVSDGAYFIENLSREFAEKGLAIFREIENSGGFIENLKKGQIQEKIRLSAQKEQELFDNGELVLIGTNKYVNPQDRMIDFVDPEDSSEKTASEKTNIEPVIESRLSEKLERQRLQEEKAVLN